MGCDGAGGDDGSEECVYPQEEVDALGERPDCNAFIDACTSQRDAANTACDEAATALMECQGSFVADWNSSCFVTMWCAECEAGSRDDAACQSCAPCLSAFSPDEICESWGKYNAACKDPVQEDAAECFAEAEPLQEQCSTDEQRPWDAALEDVLSEYIECSERG